MVRFFNSPLDYKIHTGRRGPRPVEPNTVLSLTPLAESHELSLQLYLYLSVRKFQNWLHQWLGSLLIRWLRVTWPMVLHTYQISHFMIYNQRLMFYTVLHKSLFKRTKSILYVFSRTWVHFTIPASAADPPWARLDIPAISTRCK